MSESNGSVKKYSLIRKEMPVDIEVSPGVEEHYTLREMVGDELAKWKDGQKARFEKDKRGNVVGFKSVRGLEADLISRCLYDKENNLVPAKEMTNWPPTILKGLAKDCQDLNGLTDEAEEAEKKD
jgi:hypothetical protein